MDSETKMKDGEIEQIKDEALGKVEGTAQTPQNFVIEDVDEGQFDDSCSSTTGASGGRDTSKSPQRCEEINTNEGVVVTAEKNTSNCIKVDTSLNGYTDKTEPLNNTENNTCGNGNVEFLLRQKALDRANIFLRWNLLPQKYQIQEFLDMVQGKLNLGVISEKGYDYCLLYFELLRDGLVGPHLWSGITIDIIEDMLSETRQTLSNGLAPPQTNKRRRSSVLNDTGNHVPLTHDEAQIPLHLLTQDKDRRFINDSDGEFISGEIQGTPVTSYRLSPSEGSEDNEDKVVMTASRDRSYNNLEWSGSHRKDNLECNTVPDIEKSENEEVTKSSENMTSDNENDGIGGNCTNSSSSRHDAVNRLLNPKSGCKGVSWSNRQMAWLAFWKEDNQRRSKTFSARKLGFEEAQRRAIEFLRHKREEVRMKTQAHLYEELPRVGNSTASNGSDTPKIQGRLNLASTSATTNNTPSFDLESLTNGHLVSGLDETNHGVIVNNVSNANALLLGPQPGVIPNITQQGALTAAAAAAAHQMGLPFHMATLSSLPASLPIDPAFSAAVAAATASMGLGTPPSSGSNQSSTMTNFPQAATLTAANPFFMFSATAATNSAANQNPSANPFSVTSGDNTTNTTAFMPWAPFLSANFLQARMFQHIPTTLTGIPETPNSTDQTISNNASRVSNTSTETPSEEPPSTQGQITPLSA
ncbi:AP2 domain-containing protein [Cryptosporidium andersoni]|uniref:AP2 domain-containing protein n=1 Tax=Cryptosporidium andersoni TaxID=117008 RepID=A0A1J4MT20_9CRYT|nr:AP2 domain-containing protein [Cryptosporidium andersoni]